ncbi:hypothetical protein LWI29_003665 [Acer saccharum]|uniref:Uncharacterized protein n=1 Tax=Acer saccharum TaxID=4024 RepID=A0AA39VHN3_ACESA|nr:hypothetical protein LWI29_003665 [Acer saccharum]
MRNRIEQNKTKPTRPLSLNTSAPLVFFSRLCSHRLYLLAASRHKLLPAKLLTVRWDPTIEPHIEEVKGLAFNRSLYL